MSCKLDDCTGAVTTTTIDPLVEGTPIDYEALQRWQQGWRFSLLKDAVDRAHEGEMDWDSLRDVMGRNDLPDLLQAVWTRLPQDQLIKALGDAWSGCEFPEQKVSRREWLPMFRRAGYHDEDVLATPPASITLWRGGVLKTRMAWTADREQAEWFQRRFDHLGRSGKLWTVTVGADRLLAHYHETHRRENEYVIDPTGIRPKEITACTEGSGVFDFR